MSGTATTPKPVKVQIEAGIAWVTLNRPEKRNAMNPALNAEMIQVLDQIEEDDSAQVLVLTGAGDAFSAGMDLKEYFRETDKAPSGVQIRVRRASCAEDRPSRSCSTLSAVYSETLTPSGSSALSSSERTLRSIHLIR